MPHAVLQVFRIVKGFDLLNIEDFFELDDGGGYKREVTSGS